MKSPMPMLEIEDFIARASSNAEGKSKASSNVEGKFTVPCIKSKISYYALAFSDKMKSSMPMRRYA